MHFIEHSDNVAQKPPMAQRRWIDPFHRISSNAYKVEPLPIHETIEHK
jgi:hypothetical protein